MTTQLDWVYGHEQQRPDDVWLTQPMGGGVIRDLTWRQALDEARRMATHLRSLGLSPRSHIALFSKNTAWWMISDLAIWMAGHVSVPLYPTLAPDTIGQILDHSESRLIIVGKLDGFEKMKAGIPAGLARLALPLAPPVDGAVQWADIVAKTEPTVGSPTREPDQLATIMYTSGSTGVPKGVMHSFRTMCSAVAFAKLTGGTREDRGFSYLPLAHSAERAVVETCSMYAGSRLFFAESLETFVEDLKRARPTLFLSVPRLWAKFQQGVYAKMPAKKLDRLLKIPVVSGVVRKKVLQGLGLDHVRFAGSGSAPISAELLDWYRRLGLEVLEGYGMTENFAVSHSTRPGDVRAGYIGRPHDGVEHRIAADGEVQVKSPGTMIGYYKAKDLTAEILDAEGFLHTGDRGEIDEHGRLKITGRTKELFKTSKGKYVAPAPIENALMNHEHVEQALVAGANMPQPFGMVVLSDAARERVRDPAARDEVSRSLESHVATTNAGLDPHEHLEKVVVVSDPWTIENGLLTPTLKVKRSAIESRYAPKVAAWYAERPKIVWD
jgi:long-subunit acyl-CoA synthetase (AMP-forming)